jgi:hypothetical protein
MWQKIPHPHLPRHPSRQQLRPPDAGFQASNYQVSVQFVGAIVRDTVRTMMKSLRNNGWNVQGVNGGGERTAAAEGYAEIRYASSGDLPAAQALASEVQAAKLTSPDTIISAKLTPSVAKGSLEVWISRDKRPPPTR